MAGLHLMPKVGIEPTLPGGNRILSPARLPVPPLRPASHRRGLTVDRTFARRRSRVASPVAADASAPTLANRFQRPSVVGLVGMVVVLAAAALLLKNLASLPSRLLRGDADRAHDRLRLRARRARLHARLRDPRADQLRPRRRVHARRDVHDHDRDALLRSASRSGRVRSSRSSSRRSILRCSPCGC